MGRQRIADPLLDAYSKFPDNVNLLNPYTFAAPPATGDPVITTGVSGTTQVPGNDNLSGFRFTVGGSDITITALGLWKLSGNSQSHVLEIRDDAGDPVVDTSVDLSAGTVGQYNYSAVTPTVLSSGEVYYMLMQGNSGGDEVNNEYTVTADAAISVTHFSFGFTPGSGVGTDVGLANYAVSGVNFKFTA